MSGHDPRRPAPTVRSSDSASLAGFCASDSSVSISWLSLLPFRGVPSTPASPDEGVCVRTSGGAFSLEGVFPEAGGAGVTRSEETRIMSDPIWRRNVCPAFSTMRYGPWTRESSLWLRQTSVTSIRKYAWSPSRNWALFFVVTPLL
jgi:hypothetical protein